MQVVLAEGLEIRQPLIAAIDGLRECCLSREDGVPLLHGQLSELRCLRVHRSAEPCPASRVRSQRLDACGIDDYEAGTKLGHTAEVGDIKRQQVRDCVSVANWDKSGIMDLLANNPQASH